jgi:uncharacterized protein (TIGR02145 family)
MKSNISKLALMAVITLAITFTFSCSGNGGDENGGGGSQSQSGGGDYSSNSDNSGTNGNYCYGFYNSTSGYKYKDCNLVGGKYIFDEQHCLSGGGNLVNIDYCKKNGIGIDDTPSDRPISSSIMPSSSSVMQSSSSVVPSSSSISQSSSSVVSSSSSILPSSSSMVSSSSNTLQSSSSVVVGVGLCQGFVNGTTREHYGKSKAQFCDPRDGKKYVYVTISSPTWGSQTWMAENLNYNASGSKCYNNLEDNCAIEGRLYDWATAMGLSSSCNSEKSSCPPPEKNKGICPSGWHLPSGDDVNKLKRIVGNEGSKLKVTSGWLNESYNGTDDYGFSALPSQVIYVNNAQTSSHWWVNREYKILIGDEYGYFVYSGAEMNINSNNSIVGGEIDKTRFDYVRCVMD